MKKLISIIVPCYNEEKNIPLLYKELGGVLENLKQTYDFEVIFVNDGSIDGTNEEIEKIIKNDNRIKYVEFSRNFGHQVALEAGINLAKGNAIIMMDADLQHPPKCLYSLIKKWEEGFKIVNTKRLDAYSANIFKKFTSKMFYKFLNLISEVNIEEGSADFRLIDRKIVEIFKNFPEKEKFYRGLVNWIGFKNNVIQYRIGKRVYGCSGYSLKKMMSLARVGVTSFSLLPMKFIISFGLLATICSGILLVVMMYVKLFVSALFFSSLSFLVVIIILMNSITLTGIGVVAVYLVTIYKQVQNRPNYIISRRINI